MDFEKEDKVISTFLESIGPWKALIVIGGGYAPIIYKLYFANKEVGNPPVGTRDIDSLIPRKVQEISKDNIAKHLEKAGFEQKFKDRESPPSESFTKVIEGIEVEVEFLTDDSVRFNKEKNVLVSGVFAQPLSYLKLSLENGLPFTTYSGVEGIVVSPEAWIFHKGLTFTRRSSEFKTYKDLYGIWYVATQLGNWSEEVIQRLKDLSLQQPIWYKTFKKNLTRWSEDATPENWMNLEFQDPFGDLKKPMFQRLIKRI